MSPHLATSATVVLARLTSTGTTGAPAFVTEAGAVVTAIVDVERWEAMGRPDVITITIEPGDTLNP